jgi:hypothetical protein
MKKKNWINNKVKYKYHERFSGYKYEDEKLASFSEYYFDVFRLNVNIQDKL